MRKMAWTGLAVLMLGACAQPNDAGEGDVKTADAESEGALAGDAATKDASDDKAPEPVRPPLDPYPSTYKPYPGETVLLTGAMVLTGTGERIENGAVLIADGKISAVGAAGSITAPEGAATVDAKGKWITPGIIDIHSHLGDYPSPSNASTSDGNEIVAQHRSCLGGTFRMAAGCGLHPRDRRGDHVAASAARFGEPVWRTLCDFEKRALAHGAGHEISRRALRAENGLR